MNDSLLYNDDIHKSVLQMVANITGHAVEDLEVDLYLEGDLGMDSIKMVSMMNELIRLVPPGEREAFQQQHPAADLMSLETIGDLLGLFGSKERKQQEQMVPEVSKSVSYSGARSKVFCCIAAVTGHRESELEEDLFLEGDLGIDSIKMVSLMNELMKLVPADQREEFTARHPITMLMAAQTVRDILDVFDKWGPEQPALPVCTERREEVQEAKPEYLEILHAQYPFLAAYWAVSNITIASGVVIQCEFNRQVLEEAWESLIMSQPVLRAVFEVEANVRHFGQYRLKLLSKINLPEIPVYDIKTANAGQKEAFVKERLESGINSRFELFSWPLHRIEVVLLEEQSFAILVYYNHTVIDGLGNQQFLRELLEAYSRKLRGDEFTFSLFLPQQYNQLVDRMNIWNSPEELKHLEQYLKRQGKGRYLFNPHGKILVTEPFSFVTTNTCRYWLDTGTTKDLIGCTGIFKTSLFVLLVSAYIKTIAGYQKQEKSMILNLPTGGRVYPDADATGVLGCFAQNMALSFDTELAEGSWDALVEHVRESVREAITSGLDRAQVLATAQNTKTQETLENGRMNPMAAALIRQTIKSNLYLSYIGNSGIKEQYGGIKVSGYEAYTCTNPGTIDNLVELFHDKILITSNYDSGFFERSFIDELMESYIKNVKDMAQLSKKTHARPTEMLYTVNSKYDDIIRQLFEEVCHCNICRRDFDRDLDGELGMDSLQRIRFISKLSKQVPGLDKNAVFSCRTLSEIAGVTGQSQDNMNTAAQPGIPYLQIVEQCKKTPDAVAIKFGTQEVTYRELHDSSNRLANYLRSQGIRAGSFIGILTLPGPFMLIGMLGILKAGAAYVPVDPAYPADRIEYIINHAKIEVLVTEQELNTQVFGLSGKLVRLNTLVYMDEGADMTFHGQTRRICEKEWRAYPAEELVYENNPEDLMTVFYTSGSTGKPKGVMLNHRGYMNRLEWHQRMFLVKPGERVAQRTSCCFDISVWELFWPLMYGAVVCPVRKEIVRNPWKLAQWMEDNEISIMHFVPSLFGEFVHALEDENYHFKNLRWLIFSGEALPMTLIQKWMDRYGTATGLANLYGPTEASIDVTCHVIEKRPGSDGETSIPIGKPIDNVFILNLDENMRELPDGELGELWIGGIQLANGYLNYPEKTAEAFKPNPFAGIPGAFLYKTGDLTVRKPDGSYEYHGRADHQVKIRGFRIELGEIEAVLTTVPGVSEAAVAVMEEPEGSGQKLLAAWLSGTPMEDRKVKDNISRKLPDYMIPHRIHWLECLPKNPNGKLDRTALSVEKVLRIESAGLAAAADKTANSLPEQSAGPDGLLALTPAQSWLMTYFDYPYNWTGYTRFLCKMPLDLELFNRALNELVNRHTALQCRIVQENSKWYQKIVPQREPLSAVVYDAGNMGQNQRDEAVRKLVLETVSGFNVGKWPLLKVIALRVSDNLYDIIVIGHHLISDMLTNHVLFNEIWQSYSQLLSDSELPGIHSPDQYTEYIRLTEEAKSKNLESYLQYWKEKFPNPDSVFLLPADFTKGPNNEGSAQMVHFELDRENTAVLTGKLKKQMNASVYSLLMAPLYRTLAQKTGKERIVVGHRVHGRDLGNGKLFMHTAGNFAVNYPLVMQIDSEAGWFEAVEQFQREMAMVPLNGISYDLCADMFPMYLYPDIKLASVRANYLGITDAKALQAFEFPREDMDRRYSVPEQKRISILEFFFRIEEKKLKLSIEYSCNMFCSETVTTLGMQYMKALREMISAAERRQNTAPAAHLHKASGVLDNKVAIVTGGGRGIGRAISLSLAKEGASVAIMSRTESQLEETKAQIQNAGGAVLTFSGDIADECAVQHFIREVIKTYGKIDVLVNNAGITKMMPVMNTSPEEWKKIVEVNLFGTYHMCYAVIPQMVKQKSGKIINIGSDSSLIGYPLMSAYAASKHGILGITRSLSEELKNYSIQVNMICPAMVNTDMAPAAFRSRAIEPSQVAEVAVFLASQKSNSITGEALKVYGNQDMHWFGAQHAGLLKSVL